MNVVRKNMKQLFILAVAFLFFIGCKKDVAADIRNQLTGQWEFVVVSGYGSSNIPQPQGNGNIIVFGKSGAFQRRMHDTITFNGSYKLEYRKDCFGAEKSVFLSTSDPNFPDDRSVSFDNGRLFISTPNCLQDGGSSIWRKL